MAPEDDEPSACPKIACSRAGSRPIGKRTWQAHQEICQWKVSKIAVLCHQSLTTEHGTSRRWARVVQEAKARASRIKWDTLALYLVYRDPMVQAAFVAGATGRWKVERLEGIRGPSLAAASHLEISLGRNTTPQHAVWILRGVTSHERYATRAEHDRLATVQPPLGRSGATRAALIPIAKSEEWWELSHDERRAIFEEDSHHIAIGLEYLPGIARRLYHCRDLGEPFDFLTWFEYAPADAASFEQLVLRLRATREWDYVEREIDIRLSR